MFSEELSSNELKQAIDNIRRIKNVDEVARIEINPSLTLQKNFHKFSAIYLS